LSCVYTGVVPEIPRQYPANTGAAPLLLAWRMAWRWPFALWPLRGCGPPWACASRHERNFAGSPRCVHRYAVCTSARSAALTAAEGLRHPMAEREATWRCRPDAEAVSAGPPIPAAHGGAHTSVRALAGAGRGGARAVPSRAASVEGRGGRRRRASAAVQGLRWRRSGRAPVMATPPHPVASAGGGECRIARCRPRRRRRP